MEPETVMVIVGAACLTARTITDIALKIWCEVKHKHRKDDTTDG